MTEKKSRPWLWPLLVAIAIAPLFVIGYIVIFQARYELAFDESTCPYELVEERHVGDDIRVREDRRSCQPDVEERRWVMHREGHREFELARRPLDAVAYRGDYRWTAEDENGRLRVTVYNPGMEQRSFREPGPDSGLVQY